MKVLILGDLHTGRSLHIGKPAEGGNLNSRIKDQVNLLDWGFNYCVDNDVKYIVTTGDVYQDFRPHPEIISIFMRWLKKCERAGIHVLIVMGNHDIIRSGQYVVSALDLVADLELSSATVYKNISRLELDEFTIVFIPFRDKRMYEIKTKEEGLQKLKDELEPHLKDSTKTKVAIGHLALEGSIAIGDEISDELNELYVPLEMFEWFDYVWMGHIHHPQILQEKNPHIAHIGSLDISDFSKTEIENEKIAILLDSSLDNKYKTITLPNRPLRHLKISVPSGKDSTEFVVNELCHIATTVLLKGAIVKLDIDLAGADLEYVDRDKVQSYLKEHLEVHHICGFSESRSVSTIQIDPNDAFDNSMEIAQTINKWAETRDHFENEQEREAFKAAAHEVRLAYEEKHSDETT